MKFFNGFGKIRLPLDDPVELVFQKLGVKELFPVFPLIKGFRLVESFIALEPDQGNAHERGCRLGKFRFAHTCGSLYEYGFPKVIRQVHRMGDLRGGNVANIFEAQADSFHSRKFFSRYAHRAILYPCCEPASNL